MEAQEEGPEPWLRGTLSEVPAVPRAVLHALALAEEDILLHAAMLTDEEIHARPLGLTPFAFHVRHLGHSLDRLLTYAEGESLNRIQRGALGVELEPGMSKAAMLAEFAAGLREAGARIRALPLEQLEERRFVGAKRLPSTLGGLLVHLADHSQRHAGQAVVTARLLVALRPGA
ncbi:MAG TPA: DinB family protein [Acidobacteriaceae bacterium]